MNRSGFRRNTTVFAVSQGLMLTAMTLVIATSALVGHSLAPNKAYATMPLAAQFLATMLTTIPAALLMERIGRKAGFMLATVFGISGATLAALAIASHQFWWFMAGSVLLGVFNGFGNYYRFAAADAVDDRHKSRAIGYVMAGGVVAAFIGPNLARWSKDLIDAAPFAGGYAALVVVYFLALVALSVLRLPAQSRAAKRSAGVSSGRPLRALVAQPKFVVALICATFGYGVMSLVMTATPLAMHQHAYAFEDTSFVIQWHVFGMFAPSFVTGHLILRFGVLRILGAGALIGLLSVTTNLVGTTVGHFWLALLLLGVSWNFLFVGGTTLLTEVYRPEERAKCQALNDFTVFTTVTIASLSAGALQNFLGWQAVNLGVLPLLAAALLSVLWLSRRLRPPLTPDPSPQQSV